MAPGLTALDALTVPLANINTATAAPALGAAHVRSVQAVRTLRTASMSMDMAVVVFGVGLAHMAQVVRIVHPAHMSTDTSNTHFDPEKFLEDLRRENPDELKARILKRVEDVLRSVEASPEPMSNISILAAPPQP